MPGLGRGGRRPRQVYADVRNMAEACELDMRAVDACAKLERVPQGPAARIGASLDALAHASTVWVLDTFRCTPEAREAPRASAEALSEAKMALVDARAEAAWNRLRLQSDIDLVYLGSLLEAMASIVNAAVAEDRCPNREEWQTVERLARGTARRWHELTDHDPEGAPEPSPA